MHYPTDRIAHTTAFCYTSCVELATTYTKESTDNIFTKGARCSSVVRAFAHGALGRRIDPSWGISRSSQCSTTGVTKAVVCAILSVG